MFARRTVIGGAAALVAAGAAAGGWRLATGSMPAYDRWVAAQRGAPAAPAEAAELIRLATLAPNGHNTQPWRFRVGPDRIEVVADLARRTPVVDPDDHHLHVSLGAAAETLAIAGAALGRPGEIAPMPDGLGFVHAAGAARPDPLAAAIPARQSTRAEYDGRPLAPEDLTALQAAAALPGVRLVLITDRAALDRLRDLVIAGNDVQMHDPAFIAELKAWIRFNPREAMATGDGLLSAVSGNLSVPGFLGRALFERMVTPGSENDRYARQMRSSAGCAVLIGDRADPASWQQVGRACQRLALTATARDIRLAFVNQPVEVAALRPDLAALVGEPGLRPDSADPLRSRPDAAIRAAPSGGGSDGVIASSNSTPFHCPARSVRRQIGRTSSQAWTSSPA